MKTLNYVAFGKDTILQMFEILKRIFIFSILFLLPSVVNAHGLYLSAKDGLLHANFSDRSPASGAIVSVVDEDGLAIFRDKMDEKGAWTLPKSLSVTPKFIVVEATGGHLTHPNSLARGFKGNFKRIF